MSGRAGRDGTSRVREHGGPCCVRPARAGPAAVRTLALLLLPPVIAACEDEPATREPPPTPAREGEVSVTEELQPGPDRPRDAMASPYEGDPRAIRDGGRLFQWMNCSGCHAPLGGGGMGPPLSDDEWIYGGDPGQIYLSIARGRPNGMPAYGNRLTADQIWRLVAYVETLSDRAPDSSTTGPRTPDQEGRDGAGEQGGDDGTGEVGRS